MKITYLIMLLLCSSTKPIEKLQEEIEAINKKLNNSYLSSALQEIEHTDNDSLLIQK